MAKEENKKRNILNKVTTSASLALATLLLACGLNSCTPQKKTDDYSRNPIEHESSEEPIEEVSYEEVSDEAVSNEEVLEDSENEIKGKLAEEAKKLNKKELLNEYQNFIKNNKNFVSGQIRCVVDEEGNVISVLTSDSKYLVYTNDEGEKRIYKAIEEGEESIFVEEINTRFNFIKGSKGEQYLMISQEEGAELITDGSASICDTKGDKFFDNITKEPVNVKEQIVTKTPGEVLEAFLENKNMSENVIPSYTNGAKKYFDKIKWENIENDPGMKNVLPTILEQFWAQRLNEGEIYTIKNGNLVFYNHYKNGIDNQVSVIDKEYNPEMFYAFENLNKYFDGGQIDYKEFEKFLAEAKIAENKYYEHRGLDKEEPVNER